MPLLNLRELLSTIAHDADDWAPQPRSAPSSNRSPAAEPAR
jgi:hypothetical protein